MSGYQGKKHKPQPRIARFSIKEIGIHRSTDMGCIEIQMSQQKLTPINSEYAVATVVTATRKSEMILAANPLHVPDATHLSKLINTSVVSDPITGLGNDNATTLCMYQTL